MTANSRDQSYGSTPTRAKATQGSRRCTKPSLWQLMVGLVTAGLTTSVGSADALACTGQLMKESGQDDTLKITVVATDAMKDDNDALWTWGIQPDLTSTTLQAPNMPVLTPQFTTDGLVWSPSLALCTGGPREDLLSTMKVNFNRTKAKPDAKNAFEAFRLEKWTRIDENGLKIEWRPNQTLLTDDFAGEWQVTISVDKCLALTFDLTIIVESPHQNTVQASDPQGSEPQPALTPSRSPQAPDQLTTGRQEPQNEPQTSTQRRELASCSVADVFQGFTGSGYFYDSVTRPDIPNNFKIFSPVASAGCTGGSAFSRITGTADLQFYEDGIQADNCPAGVKTHDPSSQQITFNYPAVADSSTFGTRFCIFELGYNDGVEDIVVQTYGIKINVQTVHALPGYDYWFFGPEIVTVEPKYDWAASTLPAEFTPYAYLVSPHTTTLPALVKRADVESTPITHGFVMQSEADYNTIPCDDATNWASSSCAWETSLADSFLELSEDSPGSGTFSLKVEADQPRSIVGVFYVTYAVLDSSGSTVLAAKAFSFEIKDPCNDSNIELGSFGEQINYFDLFFTTAMTESDAVPIATEGDGLSWSFINPLLPVEDIHYFSLDTTTCGVPEFLLVSSLPVNDGDQSIQVTTDGKLYADMVPLNGAGQFKALVVEVTMADRLFKRNFDVRIMLGTCGYDSMGPALSQAGLTSSMTVSGSFLYDQLQKFYSDTISIYDTIDTTIGFNAVHYSEPNELCGGSLTSSITTSSSGTEVDVDGKTITFLESYRSTSPETHTITLRTEWIMDSSETVVVSEIALTVQKIRMFESAAVHLLVTPKANLVDPEAPGVTDYVVAQALEADNPVLTTINADDYDVQYYLSETLPCYIGSLGTDDTCSTEHTLNSEYTIASYHSDLTENFYVVNDDNLEIASFDKEYQRQTCAAWTREASQTEEAPWSMDVSNANSFINNNSLTSLVTGKCMYVACSNQVALELGEEISADQQDVRLEDVTYYLGDDMLTIDLPVIETFCPHDHGQEMRSATLFSASSSATQQVSEQNLSAKFGIQVNSQTSTLEVYVTDPNLAGTIFELEVRTFSVQEATWYNTTRVQIHFESTCRVRQEHVDSVFIEQPTLELTAVQGVSEETISISDLVSQAQLAFQVENSKGCGDLLFELMADKVESEFLILGISEQTLSLKPTAQTEAGTYSDATILFYFSEATEINTSVKVTSVVEPCIVTSLSFSQTEKQVDFELGTSSVNVSLPSIVTEPACGTSFTVSTVFFSGAQTPLDLPRQSLVEFSTKSTSLKILNQENFALLDQTMSVQVVANTKDSDLTASLRLTVNYFSDGPNFESAVIVPPITCSEEDKDWQIELPSIVGEAQQQVTFVIPQIGELSKLFTISERAIVIAPQYLQLVSQGKLCPKDDPIELNFDLVSDILGTRSLTLQSEINPPKGDGDIFFFDFFGNLESKVESLRDPNFTYPTLEIKSISPAGLVTISFSEPFIPLGDTSKLKEVSDVDGVEHSNVELKISSTNDDGDEEELSFTWTVVSYTETELQLRLQYEDPSVVSSGIEADNLKFTVWKQELFRREKDAIPIAKGKTVESNTIEKKVPLQTSEDEAAQMLALVTDVVIAGNGVLAITGIVQFFLGYGMNNVLSQVRSLSIISHLMIMQLSYPAAAVVFYAVVQEFVTFDVIPTDESYIDLFGFENKPYSDEAASVGYGSCFIIFNSGSQPIFMLAILVFQFIFLGLTCIMSQTTCLYRFARRKQDDFRWAGFNDFVNEIYLTQCFAIGFNTTSFAFISTGVTVNNIFAIVMAIVVALTPIIIAIRLHRRWKQETKIGEAKVVELKEGGEIEEEVPGQDNNNRITTQKSTKGKKKKGKGKKKSIGLARNAGLAPQATRKNYNPQQATKVMSIDQTRVQNQSSSILLIDDIIVPSIDLEMPDAPQLQEAPEAEKAMDDSTTAKETLSEEETENKEKEALDERDAAIGAEYGSIFGQLAGRLVLSRRAATAFVLVFYYRRVILAVIILVAYSNPLTQVLLCGLLQLGYVIFLLHFKVYREQNEFRIELCNELVILLTNYSLMLITGDFVQSSWALAKLSYVLIGLCLLNFIVNFTPMLYSLIKGIIRRCKRRIAREKFYERQQEQAENLVDQIDALDNISETNTIKLKREAKKLRMKIKREKQAAMRAANPLENHTREQDEQIVDLPKQNAPQKQSNKMLQEMEQNSSAQEAREEQKRLDRFVSHKATIKLSDKKQRGQDKRAVRDVESNIPVYRDGPHIRPSEFNIPVYKNASHQGHPEMNIPVYKNIPLQRPSEYNIPVFKDVVHQSPKLQIPANLYQSFPELAPSQHETRMYKGVPVHLMTVPQKQAAMREILAERQVEQEKTELMMMEVEIQIWIDMVRDTNKKALDDLNSELTRVRVQALLATSAKNKIQNTPAKLQRMQVNLEKQIQVKEALLVDLQDASSMSDERKERQHVTLRDRRLVQVTLKYELASLPPVPQ